jgi:hypothetical protein
LLPAGAGLASGKNKNAHVAANASIASAIVRFIVSE